MAGPYHAAVHIDDRLERWGHPELSKKDDAKHGFCGLVAQKAKVILDENGTPRESHRVRHLKPKEKKTDFFLLFVETTIRLKNCDSIYGAILQYLSPCLTNVQFRLISVFVRFSGSSISLVLRPSSKFGEPFVAREARHRREDQERPGGPGKHSEQPFVCRRRARRWRWARANRTVARPSFQPSGACRSGGRRAEWTCARANLSSLTTPDMSPMMPDTESPQIKASRDVRCLLFRALGCLVKSRTRSYCFPLLFY
jgi:hypothetical protein